MVDRSIILMLNYQLKKNKSGREMQSIFSKEYFKFKIICFLLFSALVSISSLAAESKTVNTQTGKYKDYIIQLIEGEAPSGALNKLLITRKDQQLFIVEGVQSIRSGADLKKIENLNNITSPLLIVKDYSGGAHCCYTVTIIRLGPDFKILAQFEGSHSPIKIEKLPKPLSFRVKLSEWYAYRWACFASSPAGDVILHFNKDKYFVAIDEMRKKPLTNQELEKIINDINSKDYLNFKYAYPFMGTVDSLSENERRSNDEYFRGLLSVIFDLIYSGRSRQAREIIDRTWPGDKEAKKLFILHVQQAVKESKYYDALIALNKPYNILDI